SSTPLPYTTLFRSHIAECGHIHLLRPDCIPENHGSKINLRMEVRLLRPWHIIKIPQPCPPRHKNEPGEAPVIHQKHPAKGKVRYEKRVGGKAFMKGEGHVIPCSICLWQPQHALCDKAEDQFAAHRCDAGNHDFPHIALHVKFLGVPHAAMRHD